MGFSWSHGLRQKKLYANVAMSSAPVRVPSQRPFAPNVTSVTSVANDKGDNLFLSSVIIWATFFTAGHGIKTIDDSMKI